MEGWWRSKVGGRGKFGNGNNHPAGFTTVDPQITWAKFRAMAEGARLAS
jgi:hypothetical protein